MKLELKTKDQKDKFEEKFKDLVAYVLDDDHGVRLHDDVIYFDDMAEIIDYLRSLEVKDDAFDDCWVAYNRKGSKKKSRDYWKKLTDKEKALVLPHIKAYVSSREIQYQRDFERYLRDKTFMTVVFSNNKVLYDPTKLDKGQTRNTTYMPMADGALSWNDYYNCWFYTGDWDGRKIYDGYEDDNRPDGATIMLNNGRGTIVWNAETKTWNKI